ncbi:MAG: hypothetical protein V9E94_18580 [Microthrixaceae bacterium]
MIDLLAHGTCATALAGRTAAVFEAATVTVSHIVVDPDGGSLIGRCAAGCSISWTIGDVALRLNATTSAWCERDVVALAQRGQPVEPRRDERQRRLPAAQLHSLRRALP